MAGFTPVLRLPEDPVEWLTYLRRVGYDVPPRGREGASRPVGNYPGAAERGPTYADEVDREAYIKILEKEMAEASAALDYERAAVLRDQIFELKAEVETG